MRSSAIFSVISFLAHQAAAQAESGDVLGHGSYIASRIRRKADVNLNSGDYLKRHVEALVNRQQASPTESGMAMPTSTGPVSFNPMMNDTEAACSQALMGAKATDDSGMAACFNVNFFDNSTGYYQANVLLYQLSAPTGEWASIKPGGIELNMYFEGATAKMQPMTSMKKRDEAAASTTTTDSAATPIRRTLSARSGGPVMIESHTFLGSISAPFNAQLTNTTAMRQALTPAISISAMTTQGANVTANVTAPANAAFVNGFFSQAFISEKQAEAQAAANPPPFVLPGTTLGIDKGLYPIGLIVTSVWTIFFILFVGVGTWDRIQWRKAYRSKKPNASGK